MYSGLCTQPSITFCKEYFIRYFFCVVGESNLVLLINKRRFPKRLGNRVGTNLMRPAVPHSAPHRESFYYLTKMNNLDVTKFGVQELNVKEMVEVEGGYSWVKYAAELAAFYDAVTEGFSGLVDGLKDGFAAGIKNNS